MVDYETKGLLLDNYEDLRELIKEMTIQMEQAIRTKERITKKDFLGWLNELGGKQ